jgi:hypothetical protein
MANINNEQFQKLKTTRIGNIGEEYCIDYLERIGYTLHWETQHKSTPFDGFGTSGSTNNKHRNIFEVKVKSKTKYNTYSIHENDLSEYIRCEEEEVRKMVIMYVDPKFGELNVTTTNKIKESTTHRVWDDNEKKYLIYFTKFKKKEPLPQDIITRIKQIQDEPTN